MAAALTPLRDFCAHGVLTLVDPAVCAVVGELSGALYLVVLLLETWSGGDYSVVEAMLTIHGESLQAQLVRLLNELQRSQSRAPPVIPADGSSPSPDSRGAAATPHRLPFTLQQQQRIRAEMQAALADPYSVRTSLVAVCFETTFSNNDQDRSDHGYPRRMHPGVHRL